MGSGLKGGLLTGMRMGRGIFRSNTRVAAAESSAEPGKQAHHSDRFDIKRELRGLLEDPGPIEQLGSLRFPSTNRLAKWARVVVGVGVRDRATILREGENAAVPSILKLLNNPAWKLPKPSVLISVAGGSPGEDEEINLSEQLDTDIRRGLMEAVRTTQAWVTTCGTSVGVTALVGRALRSLDDAVCIGIAPWRAVVGHEKMKQARAGTICEYPPRNEHKYASHGAAPAPGEHPAQALTAQRCRVDISSREAEEPSDSHGGEVDVEEGTHEGGGAGGGRMLSQSVKLDHNHTHFLLADDQRQADASPWGAEVTLRTALEEAICPDNAEDDDKLEVPMVKVVVGGGLDTLRVINEALKPENDRPVVVLPDSGGAALAIYEVCIKGVPTDVAALHLPGAKATGKPPPGSEALLAEILEHSKKYTGYNKDRAVQVYEMGQQKSLRDVIMEALLDDCKNATDAIRLAVSWRDPDIIRGQLEDTKKSLDGDGIVRALERALANADCAVVQELLEFAGHRGPQRVRIAELVRAGDTTRAGAALSLRQATPEMLDEYERGEGKLWREAQDWQRGVKDEFTIAPDALFGLSVLARELEWDYSYRSNYLRFRGVRAKGKGQPLQGNWFDLMMWCVLARQPELAKLLWGKVEEPLRAALIASLICQKRAGDETGARQEELLAHAAKYEDWAVAMLSEADDAERDHINMLLLAFPRLTDGKLTVDKWIESPVELSTSSVSSSVGCKRFLAHKHCIALLESIFEGNRIEICPSVEHRAACDQPVDEEENAMLDADYVESTRKWLRSGHKTRQRTPLGYLYLHAPPSDAPDAPSERDSSWRDSKGLATKRAPPSVWRRLGRSAVGLALLDPERSALVGVVQTPKGKYVSHLVSAFLYLVLYVECTTGLLPWLSVGILPQGLVDRHWMYRRGEFDPAIISYAEYVNFGWTCCRMIEEVKQLLRVGAEGYEETERLSSVLNYFHSSGNWLDVFNYSAVLLVGGLRMSLRFAAHPEEEPTEAELEVLVVCRCLYAVAAITISLRTSSLVKIRQGFGVLYLIFIAMLGAGLVAFLSIGWGVALTILMPAQNQLEHSRPFWRPFWGLLGESLIEEAEDYFPHAKQSSMEHFAFDWTGLPSVLVPLLGFLYLFLTTIVLVNLLIAQMSSRYEEIVAKGYEEWLAERVMLIREFKDERDVLPPPLNFVSVALWLLYELPRAMLRVLRALLSGEGFSGILVSIVGAFRRNFSERRGFKLVLGGGAVEHTRGVASELRRRYLKAERLAEGQQIEGHFKRVKEQQDSLQAKLETLGSHFARINDRLGVLETATHVDGHLASRIDALRTGRG